MSPHLTGELHPIEWVMTWTIMPLNGLGIGGSSPGSAYIWSCILCVPAVNGGKEFHEQVEEERGSVLQQLGWAEIRRRCSNRAHGSFLSPPLAAIMG